MKNFYFFVETTFGVILTILSAKISRVWLTSLLVFSIQDYNSPENDMYLLIFALQTIIKSEVKKN